MKKIHVFTFALLLNVSLFPQSTWEHTFGGPLSDDARSICLTTTGEYIIAGKTESFGAGNEDFYLIKVDTSGNQIFSKTFGGNGDDAAYYVVETLDGGFCMAGYTQSFNNGGYDAWLVKTDAEGNTEWTKNYGGPFIEWALWVEQTSDSGFIITSFTDHLTTDAMLIRTDANGDTLWTKTFGGPYDDWTSSVCITTDGGFVCTGFTTTTGEVNSQDVWLIKTDANGITEWIKTYSGPYRDWGRAVTQTTDGGFIIAAGTYLEETGNSDLWLIKTNNCGDTSWTKTFGSNADDWPYATVLQNEEQGFTVAGSTLVTPSGDSDIWLLTCDEQGNLLWSNNFNINSFDYGSAAIHGVNNEYVVVGGSLTPDKANDVVVIKTDSIGNTTPITQIPEPVNLISGPEISIFPNPFSTSATIKINVKDDGRIRVEVINPATGIKIKVFENEVVTGNILIQLNSSILSRLTFTPGLCYCLLWQNDQLISVTKCMVF